MLSEYTEILFTVYSLLKTPWTIDPSQQSMVSCNNAASGKKKGSPRHFHCLLGITHFPLIYTVFKSFSFYEHRWKTSAIILFNLSCDLQSAVSHLRAVRQLIYLLIPCSFLFLNPESYFPSLKKR